MHFNNTKSAIRNMSLNIEHREKLLEAVTQDEIIFNRPTKKEILAIKDTDERQKAIFENMDLFSGNPKKRDPFEYTVSLIDNLGLSDEDKNSLLNEIALDRETFYVMTKEDILATKDPGERQKLIKENIHLFNMEAK